LLTVVRDLLDDRDHHIEFNGHLTNHAKQAVVALAGLGASPDRIRAYYDGYRAMTPYGFPLEPARPSEHPIGEGNWPDFVGRRTSFGAYCEFFDRRDRELGTDELLRRYVPALLPGWVGAFTHAAIHLGWALDVGHRWMTVEGLAYLAFSAVSCHPERAAPVGGPGPGSAVESLIEVARDWEADEEGVRDRVRTLLADTDGGLAAGILPELLRSGLQYRNARVLGAGVPLMYRTPGWIAAQDPADSWQQLHYAATLLYLARPGDFVLLHLITSLHGMEHIAERLPADRRREAVHCFWIGMLAVLFSEDLLPGGAELAALHAAHAGNAGPGPDWDTVVDRAIAEDEEHNPKMVYVLRRQWERTGQHAVYRTAAGHFTTTPELPDTFQEPPTP
jgi:hypothetical protein